jgi:hypothetical protein
LRSSAKQGNFLAMLADLPPIPNCIEQVTDLQSQSVIVRGKEQAIRAWLNEPAVKEGPFEVSASQADEEGKVTVVLRFPVSTPYRTIGGMIYSAQEAELVVGAWLFHPPFCKPMVSMP